MRVTGSVLLMVVLLLVLTPTLSGASSIPIDVGGGLLVGGYFGELRHDWQAGVGGTLFLQVPWKYDIEGRLSGSMQWNDGSLRAREAHNDPDLGARPAERPRSFRRASYTASVLWRAECCPVGDFGVPLLGAGIGTYERAVTYDGPSGTRRVSGWDPGVHAIAGVRLYRTSGMFLELEGAVRGIDTPKRWTTAYDATLLLGVQVGP